MPLTTAGGKYLRRHVQNDLEISCLPFALAFRFACGKPVACTRAHVVTCPAAKTPHGTHARHTSAMIRRLLRSADDTSRVRKFVLGFSRLRGAPPPLPAASLVASLVAPSPSPSSSSSFASSNNSDSRLVIKSFLTDDRPTGSLMVRLPTVTGTCGFVGTSGAAGAGAGAAVAAGTAGAAGAAGTVGATGTAVPVTPAAGREMTRRKHIDRDAGALAASRALLAAPVLPLSAPSA